MYRKIMGFLEAWKEDKYRKPLILQGARQVGKTYSILEFGRTHYENVAYFNFETNPKLNETFAENIRPDYLIPILSHIAGQTIVKEKTLIVFDEVQLCERALTSLKYFCEDAPDYHIVALGSLTVFVSNFEKLKRKFMQFSVRNQSEIINIYMNNNYTIFRTFKEDGSCIEKSWVFWKHGKKMNTANLLFCRGQDRWGRLILF